MPPTKAYYEEKARQRLEKASPAISGQRGHSTFLGVACFLVREFSQLGEDALFSLLLEYNERCDPPFQERDVQHKLRDAIRKERSQNGPRIHGRSSPSHPNVPRLPHAPNRPPRSEVLALWEKSSPVLRDSEVATWCRGRSLSPESIAALDLARALPRLGKDYLPRWARLSEELTWQKSDHRLLVPLYSVDGELESVRARCILATQNPAQKELCPKGYEAKGLVMANDIGRGLLRGELLPGWGNGMVIIQEGSPDFLSWAHQLSPDSETIPAVFGVFNGSWTLELASKIPSEARIIIRTHLDDAGEHYAQQIITTLEGRCRDIRRRKAQPTEAQ